MKPLISIRKYLKNYLLISYITVLVLVLPSLPYPSPHHHLSRRQAPNLTNEVLEMVKKALNQSDPCGNCTEARQENKELKDKLKQNPVAKLIQPAYDCDEWDNKTRTCWLVRNVGDTVTFVLTFSEGSNPKVRWKQEFQLLGKKQERGEYEIDPENPMWNVVIGSRGHELRLSPITEMDVDSNSFVASVKHAPGINATRTQIVNYRIRLVPYDMGFVYPGETLMLNMKSVDLPPTSMLFQWSLDQEALPSNMRLSPTGSILTIMELRKEQEGVVECSVFTNLGYLATKKRFLIKEINQGNNPLMFLSARPKRTRRQIEQKENLPNSNWNFKIDNDANSDEEMISRNIRSDPRAKMQPDDYPVGEAIDRNIRNLDEEAQNLEDNSIDDIAQDKITQREVRADKQESQMSRSPQVILEVERKPDSARTGAMDRYAKMISTCDSDLECSSDANCVTREPDSAGFCRCNAGFQGSGVFCWEENQPQNSAIFSGEQRVAVTEPEPELVINPVKARQMESSLVEGPRVGNDRLVRY